MDNENFRLDQMFLSSLVGDIVRGMCYLHESIFRFHGNLKASNCLIDGRWVLKIADFGLRDFGDKKDDVQLYLNQVIYFVRNIKQNMKTYISIYRTRLYVLIICIVLRSVYEILRIFLRNVMSTHLQSFCTRCTVGRDHLETAT